MPLPRIVFRRPCTEIVDYSGPTGVNFPSAAIIRKGRASVATPTAGRDFGLLEDKPRDEMASLGKKTETGRRLSALGTLRRSVARKLLAHSPRDVQSMMSQE